jgi:hypothetical protein
MIAQGRMNTALTARSHNPGVTKMSDQGARPMSTAACFFSHKRGKVARIDGRIREVPSASLRGQSRFAACAVPPSAANGKSDATGEAAVQDTKSAADHGRIIVNRTLIALTDDALAGAVGKFESCSAVAIRFRPWSSAGF